MESFPTMSPPEASDFQESNSSDTQTQPNTISRLMFSFYKDAIEILNRNNLEQISPFRDFYLEILQADKENRGKNYDLEKKQVFIGNLGGTIAFCELQLNSHHNTETNFDGIVDGEGFNELDGEDDEDLNKEIRREAILGKSLEARLFREKFRNNVAAKGALDKNWDYSQEARPGIIGLNMEIVEDISTDRRFFETSDLKFPTTLPHVILNQFLTCIGDNGWWEAMESLSISQKGRHVIYTLNEGKKGHYPHLLASARLLEVDPTELRNLFRSSFFRSNDWRPELDRNGFREMMEKYLSSRPASEQLTLNYDIIPENPTLAELEEGIIKILGAENMVEIIRLCFDKERLEGDINIFFESMVKIAETLVTAGKPYSYAIVEGPVITRLSKMKKAKNRLPFIVLSKHEIIKSDPSQNKGVTYKILIFNKNALEDGNGILNSIPEVMDHVKF